MSLKNIVTVDSLSAVNHINRANSKGKRKNV
jgi:hypothetical protein